MSKRILDGTAVIEFRTTLVFDGEYVADHIYDISPLALDFENRYKDLMTLGGKSMEAYFECFAGKIFDLETAAKFKENYEYRFGYKPKIEMCIEPDAPTKID